ncbi:CRISPR-associated helicase Cas3' [Candidatus Methylomirabilis sp.]|uniref:CRISPR-associated helicase Cas3' n=1 Tax=Candidatus Methylomirabilis sp. TaxID=2032687 RepID=UPI002A62D08C|nr:CRISPR-associated helicase Cas3' [Candidatus Methylomirabilis sp.]
MPTTSDHWQPLAHVAEDGGLHLLDDHLKETAQRAGEFAGEFGCSGWGYLAGLWHDLGKYSPDFQRKIHAAAGQDAHLETKARRVDHSTAGALHAVECFGRIGRILAYVAAGHHAGLPDWTADETGGAALESRLRLNRPLLDAAKAGAVPPAILNRVLPTEKPPLGADPALWIRMLFSCVVDADFLDTEVFFDPEKAAQRGRFRDLEELLSDFTAYMEAKIAGAEPTPVNRIRTVVLDQCIARATEDPGIFTLTVPTGGGKTLSSMAFALHHAVQHGKRRVLYVIPYTSIIEQTADQFRRIFGDAVVEHHSNLDVADEAKETPRSRLACENWDAPIVVTTSVQFFESLFASRTSRCRKLHSIVGSVVVLDEAQLLPPEFLEPILSVLKELVAHYGVTLLLSTATQPALREHRTPSFHLDGLSNTREIIEDPMRLHETLKRVDIMVPTSLTEPRSWEDIAGALQEHDSVLCIVNRRDDARTLWRLMPEGAFHLSALMCGAHRSAVIAKIKERLKERLPTRVVSTQLVEAGVDVDFPVVYRALAGLDSIAQAAGRCNREGLRDRGTVVVFVPQSRTPAGILRQAEGLGRQLLAERVSDPLSPIRFERFFREFYWIQGDRLDKHRILEDLRDSECRFAFRTVARKMRLIDESAYAPVVVLYGEGVKLVGVLESQGPGRWILRRLQRYTVNLPRRVHQKLVEMGAIREVHPGLFVQSHGALYDEHLGFCADRSIVYEPDELIF